MHGGRLNDARDLDPPDPMSAADMAEFIASLDMLRTQAGEPSYRTLARRIGPLMRPPRVVSQSTVGEVFQARRRRLDLDLLIFFVGVLPVPWGVACSRGQGWPRATRRARS